MANSILKLHPNMNVTASDKKSSGKCINDSTTVVGLLLSNILYFGRSIRISHSLFLVNTEGWKIPGFKISSSGHGLGFFIPYKVRRVEHTESSNSRWRCVRDRALFSVCTFDKQR